MHVAGGAGGVGGDDEAAAAAGDSAGEVVLKVTDEQGYLITRYGAETRVLEYVEDQVLNDRRRSAAARPASWC